MSNRLANGLLAIGGAARRRRIQPPTSTKARGSRNGTDGPCRFYPKGCVVVDVPA